MDKNIVEKMCQIYRKYHLTPKQMLMVQSIIWSVANKKNVLLVSPYLPGQQTVFKASREIIKLLKFGTKHLKYAHTKIKR